MFNKIKNISIDFTKKHGWKAAVGIFFYYLIRDVSLYIILPWYVAKNLIK